MDGWTNIVEGHDRETNSTRTSSFAPNPPVPLCPCTLRPPATPRLSPGYHRTALYPVRPWVRWQGPHGRKGGEGRVDRVCVHGRTGSGAPVLLPPVRLRALSNLLTYIIFGGRMRRRISENNTRSWLENASRATQEQRTEAIVRTSKYHRDHDHRFWHLAWKAHSSRRQTQYPEPCEPRVCFRYPHLH